MKIHHFASAAAAVLVVAMAAPAFAQAGYVGATYGNTRVLRNDNTTMGVQGAWSMPAGDGFSLQADGAYSRFDDGVDTLGSYQVAGTALFHGQMTNFGATVSYFTTDSIDLTGTVSADFDSTDFSVFAQKVGDRWVGLARLAYGELAVDVTDTSTTPATVTSGDANFYELSLNGQFFTTDNFVLSANASYMDPENLKPIMGGGVSAEWKMENSPLSFAFGYAFNKDVDMMTVGVRGTFGAGSLIERAKSGPVASPTFGFNRFLGLVSNGDIDY